MLPITDAVETASYLVDAADKSCRYVFERLSLGERVPVESQLYAILDRLDVEQSPVLKIRHCRSLTRVFLERWRAHRLAVEVSGEWRCLICTEAIRAWFALFLVWLRLIFPRRGPSLRNICFVLRGFRCIQP